MNYIAFFKTVVYLLALSLMSQTVLARMYQWRQPDTGTTQLSGKPPAWYRSANGGPRVYVFDNGRLIDDTAIDVADDVRQRMRQQAFILAEEDRQAAKEKLAKAQEIQSTLEQQLLKQQKELEAAKQEQENNDEAVLITEEYSPIGSNEESNEESSLDGKSLEELRKIIADWEEGLTESAKKLLE